MGVEDPEAALHSIDHFHGCQEKAKSKKDPFTCHKELGTTVRLPGRHETE